MAVITDRAEQLLISQLKLLKFKTGRFKCIYFRDNTALDADLLIRLVEQHLTPYDPDIYFCHNGTFVLSRALPFKIFLGFIKAVGVAGKLNLKAARDLMALFDAYHDRDRIVYLVGNELVEAELAREFIELQQKDILRQAERQRILTQIFDPQTLPNFNAARAGRKEKVALIVEDDRFTSQLISGALGETCRKTIAGSGAAAIDTYLREAPDVVFLDIELPDISGHEVLIKLKEMDRNVYAVMLSGHGTPDNVAQAVREEVKGFISKPFSRDKLLRHIQAVS